MRHVTSLFILATSFSLTAVPASAELFQRHGDGKIWKYDGRGQCSPNACPGWTPIDQNPATRDIAAGFGGLYQLHAGGAIWRYDGQGHCAGNACPGWTLVDKNPSTIAITGGPGGFYQRHADGKIWKYDGHGQCTTNLCPGWMLIDQNPNTRDIVAAEGTLFQRHQDGKTWRYDGRGQCAGNACSGWVLIDQNGATQAVAGSSGGFYQRHSDEQIWKYDGRGQCSANACPGWALIDKNPATRTIVAGGRGLYQLHADNKFWKYDGQGTCIPNACPGWTLIDQNPATQQISANLETVYQRHADGKIWKYDGQGHCAGNACPGWTLIDQNPATVSILAVDSGPSPILGDLVAGSPVNGVRLVLDANNQTVFSDNTFFSSQHLCSLAMTPTPPNPPLDQNIRSMIADRLSHGPFKLRSDSSVSLSSGCNGHGELAATGSPDIRVAVNLPQNSASLFLTTPDIHVPVIGSIGLPGSTDPHANIAFDLGFHTTVVIPPVSGRPLTSKDTGGLESNLHVTHENFIAEALAVLNDVQKFFTGNDLLKGLTQNVEFSRGGLGNFLDQFNSKLSNVPPDVAYVASYDRASRTLILRTAQ